MEGWKKEKRKQVKKKKQPRTKSEREKNRDASQQNIKKGRDEAEMQNK